MFRILFCLDCLLLDWCGCWCLICLLVVWAALLRFCGCLILYDVGCGLLVVFAVLTFVCLVLGVGYLVDLCWLL